MKIIIRSLCGFALLFAVTGWAQERPRPVENDLMYPAAESAKGNISYDGAGFVINGERTFFSSGSIHYPRVPSELWFDRLLRLKQASFAAVETYAFWNFHEPKENEFNFRGDRDFEKFLQTAQQLDLYAMVRVGPYVCAEWDSGGYPIWLKFKPPFPVRANNPAWLAWNDHWYEKIMPLVAKHQVNHGGNVALVQLENEHPQGWGVVTNNPYFVQVSEQAKKYGLEVPYFMSGQHHGKTPVPGNLDPSKRSTPWITTEFWVGWYNTYGALATDRNHEIETGIWNIIGHGGGGYNFYMFHGGTDFENWNNDEIAASYDDGAVIGQAGDLRPLYYRMKRANQLAQAFPNILANGADVMGDYRDFATGSGVRILGARKSQSGNGTFVFVRNSTSNETTATFKSGETLRLSSAGVYPLPRDVDLTDGVKISDSTLPVLAVARNEKAVTLVVYGHAEETGRVTLSFKDGFNPQALIATAGNIVADFANSNLLNLKVTIPAHGVQEISFNRPNGLVRVLAMNEDLSLYTWILGEKDRQYVVCGPAFVQKLQPRGKKLSLTIERSYGQPAPGQVAVFGGRDQSWHLEAKGDLSLDTLPAPKLEGWKMATMKAATPEFDDSKWKRSETPLQMGADGDISAFAWYRASFKAATATNGLLHFQGADNLEVFVNGQKVPNQKGTARADFVAGKNTIAVFTSHHGRNKNYNYLGTLDNRDNKGLWGSPTVEFAGSKTIITGWSMHGGVEADLKAVKRWTKPEDTKGAPAFYNATFKTVPPALLGAHPILRVNYRGLSRGTMWVNGHNLGRYPEKIKIDSLYIPECWLKSGQNTLTVFDEQGASPAQVELLVETAASREVIQVSQPTSPEASIIVPHDNL